MTDHVRDFFQWLADALIEGDLSWLDDVYIYPMSLFYDGQIRVEHTTEETRAYIVTRRTDAIARGIAYIHCDVVDIQPKGNGRFAAMIHFIFRDKTGADVGKSVSRYLCRDGADGTIRIESIEFIRIGLPGAVSLLSPRH